MKDEKEFSQKDLLAKIWITISRIQGYVEGSTKGIVDRLNSIDDKLEELLTKKKRKKDD